MNASATRTAPESARDPDPREVLDLSKRADIAAFLRLGCSRRMAAEMVGCHHTTITRTAQRHPEFARLLADAESAVDIAALERIQKAGEENKNWRAAAWVLERRHPEEFGRRTPHAFCGDQIMALLSRIFAFTIPVVPKECVEDFMRQFNLALRDVEAETARPDRWRKMAGIEDGSARHQAYFRSPYDHPQWFDPNRPDRLLEGMPNPQDPVKFQEWMHQLNAYEFEAVCRKVREKVQQERELEQAAKDGRLGAVTGLKFAESDADGPADGPAGCHVDGDLAIESGEASPKEAAMHADLSAEREEYVETISGDAAARADLSAEPEECAEGAATERPARSACDAVPELACQGRTGKSVLQAAQPRPSQPPASVPTTHCAGAPPLTCPPIPLLNDKPPTPEVHQAYQQWQEQWLRPLGVKSLAGSGLPHPAGPAPAEPVVRGGAQVG
jgi:hypothetical protein